MHIAAMTTVPEDTYLHVYETNECADTRHSYSEAQTHVQRLTGGHQRVHGQTRDQMHHKPVCEYSRCVCAASQSRCTQLERPLAYGYFSESEDRQGKLIQQSLPTRRYT